MSAFKKLSPVDLLQQKKLEEFRAETAKLFAYMDARPGAGDRICLGDLKPAENPRS